MLCCTTQGTQGKKTLSLSWAFFQTDVAKMLATLKADVFSLGSMDDVSMKRNNHICFKPHKEAEASKNAVPFFDIFTMTFSKYVCQNDLNIEVKSFP
jgi:hypothetical protein